MTLSGKIFIGAFPASRHNRSPACKRGVMDALRHELGESQSPHLLCPYAAGTTAADAWLLGTEEGFRLAREHLIAGESIAMVAPAALSDTPLADIEARLTQEVIDLATVLLKFSRRTRLIGKELPDTAQFGQLITRLLSLSSLHVAQALLKDSNVPLLSDNGAEYLSKLGLHLKDFIREIRLDDRRFLAIAILDARRETTE